MVPTPSLAALDTTVRPSVYVPMADSDDVFYWGYGLGLEASVRSPFRWLQVWGRFDAFTLPHKAHGTLVMVAPQLGIGLDFDLSPEVSWGFGGGGGAFVASKGDAGGSASGPWITGGTNVRWHLSEQLNFRGSIDYEAALGLLQGLGIWLGFELTEAPHP